MTFLKLLVGGLITAAAYGSVRYWLTHGREQGESNLNVTLIQPAPGTGVPEGTAVEKET